MHPKRRTIGIRVPDNRIALAILQALNEPMLSSTLIMPGETLPMTDAHDIRDLLEHQVDLVIDGGYCGLDPTTVVDLTEHLPQVLRVGCGDPQPFMSE
jgi:tRNA threonylcarbamoyl adenosine modification protein (Sua5/YciO/YrdC/YwlC family)